MNLKQLKQKYKKRHPKAWHDAEKSWDYKMIGPVTNFICDTIFDNINPRLGKLAQPHEYIYNGPELERALWKLLAQVRRITQREK